MSKKDGGPAFPHPNPEYAQDWGRKDRTPPFGGMSLRDWFAGQALLAIIEADGAQYFHTSEDHAQIAYAHADAMLAERTKP